MLVQQAERRENIPDYTRKSNRQQSFQNDGFVATGLDGQLTPIYHPHGWSLVL